MFYYQWILVGFTFFYERMYQNRNHNYHINYFVKNHNNIKCPLILQSMIHFVSLFISKTYQNMIVNLLLAFFRQIFEMTDTCIYREIFLFFHRYWDGMHGYLQRDTLDTQVTKMGNYMWQGAWQNGDRPVRTPVEISIKWTVKCLVHGYPRCMLICHYLPCLGWTTQIYPIRG